MGGLSHYFEEEGLPTTGISLIREHTEGIRPPRALWVPFDLGRPLGPPDDPAFQRSVVLATLRLLERADVPVLEEYGQEAPTDAKEDSLSGLACPLPPDAASEWAQARTAVMEEIRGLRPSYELSLQRRGQTSYGVLGEEPEVLAEFVLSFLRPDPPKNPRPDLPLPHALKLAVDDLNAFYSESAMIQHGQGVNPVRLATWFWGETALGSAIQGLRKRLESHPDPVMRAVAYILFAPFEQTAEPFRLEKMGENFPHLMPAAEGS